MSKAILVMEEDGKFDEYRTWPIASFHNKVTAELFIEFTVNKAKMEAKPKPKLFTEEIPYYAGSWEFEEKDNCSVCHGEKAGVAGNENVIEGKLVCDYCHAEMLRENE